MAKKAQAIQLQTEVNNDDEWEKLLQRNGLIVVDVYSEWCGPCTGMLTNLKKIKLEIGGDMLQLAMAKADKITALERFRYKSEPTWMFIVNGKLVNFMFGANSPKLLRLITEELKKEQDARDGRRERVEMPIDEPTEEERDRLEILHSAEIRAKQREIEKIAKELFDRRTAEANQILENLNHFAVALILPHARTKYIEAFGDLLSEAGLTITQTEKIIMQPEQIQDLFYFADEGDFPFDDDVLEEMFGTDLTFVLLFKPIPSRDLDEPTDDILREVVYGPSRHPPGAPGRPAQLLLEVPQPPDEEGNEVPSLQRLGIWVPLNEQVKATALRLFFTRQSEPFLIPEPEPVPAHYAVIFDSFRRHEIIPLLEKYPAQFLRYGFFTSEVPEEAAVVAKSMFRYDRAPGKTNEEKLVIQLAKTKSECMLAVVQLKPDYVSPNVKEGERECRIFFPEDYDEPPEEDELEYLAAKEEIARERAEMAEVAKEAAEAAEAAEAEAAEAEAAEQQGTEGEEGTAVEGEQGEVTDEGGTTTEEVVTTDVGETTDEEPAPS